jgi:hypothetical protein
MIVKSQSTKNTKEEARTWNYSGSVDINLQIDNINLRDFAYD